nr:MAG TPA: hypothetical protein [Caudoviricetes sp.]
MCVHDVRATVNAHDEWAFFAPNRLRYCRSHNFCDKVTAVFPNYFCSAEWIMVLFSDTG